MSSEIGVWLHLIVSRETDFVNIETKQTLVQKVQFLQM